MSATHSRPRARAKARSGDRQTAGPSQAPASRAPRSAQLGPHYAAGPVAGLAMPAQTKLAVGQAGDAFEQQANQVANHVTSESQLAPPSISPVTAGALSRAAGPKGAEEKKPEPKPAQKADAPKEPEKKPEKPPAQKAEGPKPEEKKPEKPPAQKAEKEPEQKLTQKLTQKAEAPKPEEKKPAQTAVQRQEAAGEPTREPEEEPPVQTQQGPKPEEKKPDQRPAQKAEERAPATGGGAAQQSEAAAEGAGTAERVVARPGPGRPMNPETRGTLESRMNADLDDVRVHDDGEAHEAAREMNARAFTHGRDIWLGRGESDADVGLMAHEATHVMQQSGGMGVQRQLVQLHPASSPTSGGSTGTLAAGPTPEARRQANQQPDVAVQLANGGGKGGPKKPDPRKTGTVDKKTKMITMPELKLPTFKKSSKRHKGVYEEPLVVKKGKKEKKSDSTTPGQPKKAKRDTAQIQKWSEAVKASNDTAVTKFLAGQEKHAVESGTSKQKVYFLKSKTARFYQFGTVAGLQSETRVPYWDRNGKERLLEVDHKKEIQLGGVDDAANYELLDSDANYSSGVSIRNELQKRVRAAVTPYSGKDAVEKIWDKVESLDKIAVTYDMTFEKVSGGLPLKHGGDPQQHWGLEEVKAGDHLKELKVMTRKEVRDANLQGSEDELVIYTAPRGGTPRRIDWKAGRKQLDVKKSNFYKGFHLTSVYYNPDNANLEGAQVGHIKGKVFPRGKPIKETDLTWPIRQSPGIANGGYIDDIGILDSINQKLNLNQLSPIQFQQARVDDDKGFYAVGQVLPTVPLFKDVGIDLVIEGDDVRLRKLFSSGEFSFPGPIKVTDSTLELSIGTRRGLAVNGEVQFEIEKVGQGKLGAGASTGTGEGESKFAIEGEFNFDSNLFDEAKIEAWYRNDQFGAKGRLAINKANKIKGIKKASVDASYGEGRLAAAGSAELSVPGVKKVDLALSYSEKEGLAIGGSFELADNIPGIKSGSGQAMIKQNASGGYDISASGKAVPNIPGIDTTLTFSYANGLVTIEGTAAYQKGMLKGSVMVGVTNRPVDDQGRPGGEPADKLTLYGGGSVTIKIAPWLQGTVGIRLLPNGEIEVSGAIGLPQSLDIFPEKKLDKNIFKVGIDIPIVGLSVAGQRVGIFANITGGADLSAGIGPGQLQELGLSITYNPARESETHVTGGAKLHIPAHAGLRLFVRGGLGVGIPLVSAQAGIEIGGAIGLEGALDAGVTVDWTPTQGLKLDAFGEIYVEPKLKFDITGFVLVEFDYWIDTATLYEKRWQLAGFEYGSGLRFGVKFPVKYEEGKPFDIALSDVQFQVPDIKPKELLGDLVKQIA